MSSSNDNNNPSLLSSSNKLTESCGSESDLADSSAVEGVASDNFSNGGGLGSDSSSEPDDIDIFEGIENPPLVSSSEDKSNKISGTKSLSSPMMQRQRKRSIKRRVQGVKPKFLERRTTDCGNDDFYRDESNLDDGISDEIGSATDTTAAANNQRRADKSDDGWQQHTSEQQQSQQVSAPMLRARMHLVKRGRATCGESSSDEQNNLTIGATTTEAFVVGDQKLNRLRCGNGSRPALLWSDRLDKVARNKFESIRDKNDNNLFNPGERNQCSQLVSRGSNQNRKKSPPRTAIGYRCSEFGAPPSYGILNLLKNLFNSGFADLKETYESRSDTGNKSSSLGSKSSALNSNEWKRQQREHQDHSSEDSSLVTATGNSTTTFASASVKLQQQETILDHNNNDMPNSQSTNYGGTSELRMHSSNCTEQDSKRRMSSSRRTRDPYGYSRLSSQNQKLAQQSSICQEYASKDVQLTNILLSLSIMFRRLLLLLVIVAICGVILWQIYQVLLEEEINYLGVVKESPSELGKYHNYAVSTDAQPCAKVGKALLARGGHAVDAAIGTLICMGVVLPNSLGLGGGCLMTIYDNVTKQATIIDGREQAPDYAHEAMFSSASPLDASRGPLSVGVPGELAAYWEAHRRFGRLNWADLFGESIKMAEEGSPTVEHLAYALRAPSHAKHITEPLKKVLWNNETGDYVAEGELLKQPALAQTLRRIRDNGVDEFYRGPTGLAFIGDLQRQGGKMTMDNLGKYKALVKNATVIDLNSQLKVYTQPVPGSGIVLSIILRIMRELGYFQNAKPKQSLEAASLYYHHLAEAFKMAYAQRGALEDLPDDPRRMEELTAELGSDAFIKQAASKIKDHKTLPIEEYGGLKYFQEDHGTAHASVIDHEGNSVAVTSSINLYFGSGLVSPTTGIIYNDVMDDFVSANITNKFGLLPSKYNHIRAGRRPISSMAPSVFVDGHGNPRLVIGASGGSKITTAIASVSLRNLFMNEDIKTAIDGARVHHQFLPDKVWFEWNFPPELLALLVTRGHGLQKITDRSSVVMAVACDYMNNSSRKLITANSDYRKGGSVAGV